MTANRVVGYYESLKKQSLFSGFCIRAGMCVASECSTSAFHLFPTLGDAYFIHEPADANVCFKSISGNK